MWIPRRDLYGGQSSSYILRRPPVTLHGVLVRSNVGACGQFYRHAVGGTPVGVRPGLLARNQDCGIGQALGSDQMLESRKPMIIVVRTVVWFPATRGGVELVGERCGPFLPCEKPLLGELHCERERLGLPRFGKHRLTLVSRQPRKRFQALGFRNRIRRPQGSRPTCRDIRHRAMRPAPPTAHARRTAPSTGVADSRRGNRHWCPGRRGRHGPDGLCQACRARSAVVACGQSDGYCGHVRPGPP